MSEPVNQRILVVDDEESMRDFLSIMLHREGYHVEVAADGNKALARLKTQDFDLVISDIRMPGATGLELLAYLREHHPETMTIMITAFSTTEEAVDAMKQGAYDYITKPFRIEEIRLIVRNAMERKALRSENRTLRQELGQRYAFGNLVGKSKAMQELFFLIEKVAASKVNVLITGESGTGKELVAKAIHYNSERRDKPFVAVNCGAIPENLLESELFGHEKGAFTGAMQAKSGLFEVANGGTIFLDEIGELPPAMQVKILRVLQEREIRRVGATRDTGIDVRLLAATNKDLEDEVRAARFREDLFYRLNVIRISLPPLRERREDIPLLVSHFIALHSVGRDITVSDSAMRALLDYQWPGNIRELHNVLERCLVLDAGKMINAESLPDYLWKSPLRNVQDFDIPETGFDLDAHLAEIEKQILLKALLRADGIRTKAAELLHMTFRSFRYRLSKYGLAEDDEE